MKKISRVWEKFLKKWAQGGGPAGGSMAERVMRPRDPSPAAMRPPLSPRYRYPSKPLPPCCACSIFFPVADFFFQMHAKLFMNFFHDM